MDRVHRVGQTKEVHIFSPYFGNSIEARVVAQQNDKLTLAAQVTGDKHPRDLHHIVEMYTKYFQYKKDASTPSATTTTTTSSLTPTFFKTKAKITTER